MVTRHYSGDHRLKIKPMEETTGVLTRLENAGYRLSENISDRYNTNCSQ